MRIYKPSGTPHPARCVALFAFTKSQNLPQYLQRRDREQPTKKTRIQPTNKEGKTNAHNSTLTSWLYSQYFFCVCVCLGSARKWKRERS